MTFLQDGNIAFTWNGRGTSDRRGVLTRIFANDGSPISDEIQVNQFRRGLQLDPAIAADSNGGFWVTWDEREQGPGEFGFTVETTADGRSNQELFASSP